MLCQETRPLQESDLNPTEIVWEDLENECSAYVWESVPGDFILKLVNRRKKGSVSVFCVSVAWHTL